MSVVKEIFGWLVVVLLGVGLVWVIREAIRDEKAIGREKIACLAAKGWYVPDQRVCLEVDSIIPVSTTGNTP